MSSFTNAVINQEARTQNGMKARASTADAVTDLFYKIGASRGKNIIPEFTAAFVQEEELALRIALWARDIRAGAGERQLFRDILLHLEQVDGIAAINLMFKTPEIGRWDDLLVLKSPLKHMAFQMIETALLVDHNGLCAKWMPRKGEVANELRRYLKMSPKQYRQTLVALSETVETKMCARDWSVINYSHIPSVASARYKKAFKKHDAVRYGEWASALVKGVDKDGNVVKVNAGAIYPYTVIQGVYGGHMDKSMLDHVTAQWNALPDYMNGKSVLPVVDVSGSMGCQAGGSESKSGVTCLHVALSLGLYCADKNKGNFKDTFLTFSSYPELLHLKGNIVQKLQQMNDSKWNMSTDLHAAMDKILSVAVKGSVPKEEMPEVLLILSDMQFNCCQNFDDSVIQMISRKFEEAGYNMPQVVFWNLNANDNVPVKHNEQGVALVSGFSPSILKSVLAADFEEFTPRAIMLKTIMNERYNLS